VNASADPALEITQGFRPLVSDTEPSRHPLRGTGRIIGSGIVAFVDPDDFEAALGSIGRVELLAIGGAPFRARMTQIVSPHLRLSSAEEFQPRVAFVSPAPGLVRVLLPLGRDANFFYCGVGAEAGEIVTHAAGSGGHERLLRPCRWGDVLLSISHLHRFGRALTGRRFSLPPGVRRWRPAPSALEPLIALHAAAIGVAKAYPGMPAGAEAAHGLEQELTEGLIECLSGSSLLVEPVSTLRCTPLMARFEAARASHFDQKHSAREIAAALGVSARSLRQCCKEYLDMTADRYLRARRLQTARRALRHADAREASVSEVARRHGFGQRGRFAASYRALFGELPSATLRG
jgi:AraC-like DNA-binding protein